MVTTVPPTAGPDFGETEVTTGGDALNVNPPLKVAVWLSGFLTTTSTTPAACDAVVPVMVVPLTVTLVRADPPKVAVAPGRKLVPMIVTDVPPLDVP